MSEDNEPNVVKFDVLHLLLWLIKDTLWVMGFKYATILMIFPTVGYTIYLLYKSRKDRNYFVLYLAIFCWLLGNAAWVLNDFLFGNQYDKVCYVFFFMGIAISTFKLLKK